MANEHDNDFSNLTFSQREGKVPLPEPMQPEHIPKRFRQSVWKVIDGDIQDSGIFGRSNLGSIVIAYQFDVRSMLHDEIGWYNPNDEIELYEPETEKTRHFFKESIIKGSYDEVLTLLEFVLRQCDSENLRNGLVHAFDNAPVAYFVQEINGRLTIMPRISKESGEATRQAIQAIQDADMTGASTHLRQAAEHINAQRFADSIVDSIYAVESVARRIDPKSKTLGTALDSLKKAGLIKHPAIKEAFSKLYGYTSDEQGIRHALLNRDSANVGVDEAVFMFGACASFAAYLANKHRRMQGQEDRDQ